MASTTVKKILIIGDGFADPAAAHLWYQDFYKWPTLINLMAKNIAITNMARYGAGNEYMSYCLQSQYQHYDLVLIQWSKAERLDLVLDHTQEHLTFWQQTIAQDPVYQHNVVDLEGKKIWISSASKNQTVVEYHQKYITPTQHQMRSQLLVEHAMLMLEANNIDYRFMLTYDAPYLSNINARWMCHKPLRGQHSFRSVSKHSQADIDYVQPIPLVSFDYIRKVIQPNLDLDWRSDCDLDALEVMLLKKHQLAMKQKPNDTN
jgi:hypothetical protein